MIIPRQGAYPEPFIIPESNRIYAVGDVHGEKDKLLRLLRLVECDLCNHPLKDGQKHSFAFLGDNVDKGPDSKGVLDIILNLLQKNPNSVALEGNHDDDFRESIAFLNGTGLISEEVACRAMKNDFITFESYGIQADRRADDKIFLAQMKDVIKQIPSSHVALLNNMPFWAISGKYILLHCPYDAFGKHWAQCSADEGNKISKYLFIKDSDKEALAKELGMEGKVIIHGDMHGTASPPPENYLHRVGVVDGTKFYKYDSRREYKPWEQDAIGDSINCAVLEPESPQRFLTVTDYKYPRDAGPSG